MQVLIIIGLVVLAGAAPDYKPCVYDSWGLCRSYCPEGTYSYNSGCRPMTPEPTCENPLPQATDYDLCDYSACYCSPPTVRDTATNTCVRLEQCPEVTTAKKTQPQRNSHFIWDN